jgi:hypothetical protein
MVIKRKLQLAGTMARFSSLSATVMTPGLSPMTKQLRVPVNGLSFATAADGSEESDLTP